MPWPFVGRDDDDERGGGEIGETGDMSRRRLLLMTIVAFSLGAGCTGQVENGTRPVEPTQTSQPAPRPLSTTSIEAMAVSGTSDLAVGGSVAVSPASGRVTVGYGNGGSTADHPGVAVVSFGALPGPSSCISRVVLHISVTSPPLTPPVAVYPVKPWFHELAPGASIDSELLIDNRPRSVVAFSGLVGEADVTSLARKFVAGGPVASGNYLKAGSPLVVSVQPENLTSAATFELLTADPAPRLTITRSC